MCKRRNTSNEDIKMFIEKNNEQVLPKSHKEFTSTYDNSVLDIANDYLNNSIINHFYNTETELSRTNKKP